MAHVLQVYRNEIKRRQLVGCWLVDSEGWRMEAVCNMYASVTGMRGLAWLGLVWIYIWVQICVAWFLLYPVLHIGGLEYQLNLTIDLKGQHGH